jgi:hypothetical protein
MKLAIHAAIEVIAVAFALIAVFMISTGLNGQEQVLPSPPGHSLDPREGADTRREDEVVDEGLILVSDPPRACHVSYHLPWRQMRCLGCSCPRHPRTALPAR